MEASPGMLSTDMTAMTLHGSNTEPAVAQLKRFRSMAAQGASSSAESASSLEDHVKLNASIEPAPGPSLGKMPRQPLTSQPSGVEHRRASMDIHGQSSKAVDSALGKALTDADHPQYNASTASPLPSPNQTIASMPHQNDTAHGPQQNTSVALSKTGKRRGRPPGSKNRERPKITNPQSLSDWSQHQLLPKLNGSAKTKKDATPDQKLRSAKISEAMKASWARRRENESGGPRLIPPSEGSLLEKRVAEDVSGQGHAHSVQLNGPGIPRKLFKGQHAIRSGSGHKLAGSALRKPSKDHTTLYNVSRIASSVNELGQLPDTSGGPATEDPPMICKGDSGLIKVFRTCVHPTALSAIHRYRDTVLSTKALNSICKQVATTTINERFVAFLQQTEYKLDRPQRKLIRKYVKSSFAAAANIEIERIRKQMLKSQSIRPKLQAGSHEPLAQEIDHGFTDFEEARRAPKTEHTNSQIYKAEETAQHIKLDEQKPLSGRSEPAISCSQLDTPVQVEKDVRLPSPDSYHLSGLRSQRALDPELELAMAKVALGDPAVNRPYKSFQKGHVDFTGKECVAILHTFDRLDHMPHQVYPLDTGTLYQQIKARIGQLSQASLARTVKAVSSASQESMTNRKKKSVRAFLEDLHQNSIPCDARPKIAIPKHKPDPWRVPKATIHALLRDRESGTEGLRKSAVSPAHTRPGSFGPCSSLANNIGARIAEDIRPWRSWKGASSDVVVVAWAPDSLAYAAGAAAQSDDQDIQYNRPNNCLFGQLESNTISELPEHCIARPKPETISSGPNAIQAVYDACDPVVYKTVTSVQFCPSGGQLYTASHDMTAKIWDIGGRPIPRCTDTLYHDAAVTGLEVSTHFQGVFATAAKSTDHSIRVYQPLSSGTSQTGYQFTTFSSPRAVKHSSQHLYPECIRWGLAPGSQHLLLGGFQQWSDQDFSATRQGDICLWDVYTGQSIKVRPHASAIFAAAWHPRENVFITGGAPGTGVLSYPKTTQSVVRIYDARHTADFTAELECPALDMQDVTFHPFADYITAGCTDGTAYVWDRRMPDYILHRLKHGEPLQELAANDEELPDTKHRERVDAGVMLSIWGHGASLFYTGSSDGIVKAWDVRRAPEDVWVKDVARLPAGVQSGALSPDGLNMLVGDAVGGVHVFSAAPLGCSSGYDNANSHNPDPITFVPATNPKVNPIAEEGTEGINAANELLQSGQLVTHPSLGVGKGPNYGQSGYFAHYARWYNDTTGYHELLPDIDRKQAFNVDGVEQSKQSAKISNLIMARQEQMRAEREKVRSLVVSFGQPTPFVANRRSTGKAEHRLSPDPLEAVSQNPELTRVGTSESKNTTPQSSPSVKRSTSSFIDLEIYVSPSQASNQKRKRDSYDGSPCRTFSKRNKVERSPSIAFILPDRKFDVRTEIVDLTGDDIELAETIAQKSALAVPEIQPRPYVMNISKAEKEAPKQEEQEAEAEEDLLSYEEWIEEDHWWPE
ncbi:MAG: hypothetical protein Q9169_006916 [Polycauliona sp. 2 TL-2023]